MKIIYTLVLCLSAIFLYAQSNVQQSLSVNSTGAAADASAQLDVSATDKGMLVPRMTSAQRTAIASPATGLLVFDTTTGGFWFYNGTAWQNLSTPKNLADADNDTKIQVEESPDEDIIRFDLGGTENMVLRKNASGYPRLEFPNALDNTFIGLDAGSANTTGGVNTALGMQALFSNTIGSSNTATGWWSLFSNTSGIQNTASGTTALYFNSTGQWNTGIGREALFNNSTGSGNTALGRRALKLNTLGSNNMALGHDADVLSNNLTNATAIGYNAKVAASNSLVLGGTDADAVKVGIGLTTPNRPLQVYSDAYGISHTFGGVELSTYIGDNAAWLGTATDHPLYFFTNDAPGPHMMIDNVGKVGIGTASPNASALLDLTATDKGVLVPRMSSAQRTAIASPATGLLVYDTNTNAFWYYNGTAWTTIGGGGVSTLIADTDNDTKIQVEESPDEDIIRFDLAGTENMVLRKNAGGSPRVELPNALQNNFIGINTGINTTTGTQNTAFGNGALFNNTTGFNNLAIGVSAMNDNTGGSQNTAVGGFALFSITTATENTAVGAGSLTGTTGNGNTGVGVGALSTNSSGANNTGIGKGAGVTTGNLTNATAIGYNASVNNSDKVRIGNTSVTVIEGQVDWTFPSDARFKFNIHDETVPGLAFINQLRPVTYQFDTRKFDEHLMQHMPDSIQQQRLAGQDYSKSTALVQTGFLAQEVEQVCKDLNFTFSGLHVPTSEVDNYGLAYGSFVPLLVKAVQEQQAIIEAQQAEIDRLKKLETQLDKITVALAGAGIAVEK